MHLARFVDLVYAELDRALVAAELPADQLALLRAMLARHRARLPGPQSDPLAPFWFAGQPAVGAADPATVDLAVGALAFYFALRLVDDVQDGETRHYAACASRLANPAIVANDALVLFALSADRIRSGAARLDPIRCDRVAAAHRRAWTASNRGQLADLTTPLAELDPDAVLALQREKAATTRLVVELAAIVADRDLEAFGAIGELVATVFQILNDVNDLYAKPVSVDLEARRPSYPVVEFLVHAGPDEVRRFHELVGALPASLPEIRRLVYADGAVARTGARIEALRRELDSAVLAVPDPTPGLRSLVQLVDRVCAALYRRSEPVREGALLCSDGPWHREIRTLAAAFCGSMADLGPPIAVPWPQAVSWYDERVPALFYPDLEGLPEEIGPVARALLGADARADDLRPAVRLGVLHQLALSTSLQGSDEGAALEVVVRWAAAYDPGLVPATLALRERLVPAADEPATAGLLRSWLDRVAATGGRLHRMAS